MGQKRLGWFYLAGTSQYRAKMKGKLSQKFRESKGMGILLGLLQQLFTYH